MKLGYISAQKLESERSKSSAVSISLQTKAIRSYFKVPGLENNASVLGNGAEVGQNRDARKAISATLSVSK